MFTGIVEELGVVKRKIPSGRMVLLEVSAQKTVQGTEIGDSIALNGACLTVISAAEGLLGFEAMPETCRKTNIGLLKPGEKVNLERSLKLGDRISGHFVSGHVDCLGLVRMKGNREGNTVFDIAIPDKFSRYCLPRGSICLDGISLTIARKRGNILSVYVIPHTLENTTLGSKGASARLNVEFDMLAKGALADSQILRKS